MSVSLAGRGLAPGWVMAKDLCRTDVAGYDPDQILNFRIYAYLSDRSHGVGRNKSAYSKRFELGLSTVFRALNKKSVAPVCDNI
jgi:hypothetical protein